MPTPPAPSPPPDPAVPALAVLLGPDAAEVLQAGAIGPEEEITALRCSQVRYVPGKSVTAQYRTTIRSPDGTATTATLVATSGIAVPETATVLEADGMRIAAWRVPDDPFLPGLAPASEPDRAAALLTRLGAPAASVQIRTRAYRAGRRAVLEVTGDTGTIFVKVLRPRRIAGLQGVHVELAPHLPIPRSLGWSRKLGIVAMQALGGATLRRALEVGGAEQPAPGAVVELLDRFPVPGPEATEVAGAYTRASDHARLLGAVLPAARPRLEAIVSGLASVTDDEPAAAVHGDFHSSQLLVAAGRIVGLVDVDTAGRGQRADDLAGLIGQLATVATVSRKPAAIAEYRGILLDDFSTRTDPAMLRRRVAGVILGLATGPFRVQLPDWPEATTRRLELAESWLADAKEISVRP